MKKTFKMKKINIVFCSIIVLLFVCCAGREVKEKDFNLLTSKEKEINLSDISDDIKYIKLDLDKPITSINKLISTDSYFFISCHPYGIIKITKNGKEITKIGNIGRGPSEYTRSDNFAVDPELEKIFVMRSIGEIIEFNYDGDYTRSFKMQEPSTFGFINSFGNNKIMITDSNSDYYWRIIDLNGNIIQERKNYLKFEKPVLLSMNPGQIVEKSNNNFIYYNSFNDTIFKITKENYDEYMVFYRDEFRMTPERFIKESPTWVDFNDLSRINMPKFWRIQNIFATNNFTYFCYSFNYQFEIVILDKHSGEQYYIKDSGELNGIRNDFDGDLPFLAKEYFVENGNEYLISWIDAYALKTYVSSDIFKNSTPKFPEKKKQLEQLANSLNENDNPVLMLVKLKE